MHVHIHVCKHVYTHSDTNSCAHLHKMSMPRDISIEISTDMPIHIDVRLKDGKKIFCHNCRFINKHVNKKKFKIETLNKEGRSIFAECEFSWLIDLSHAYYHIQVDRAYWK